MKKIKILFTLLLFTLSMICISCTKNEDSVSSTDNISSPFTIKYEIIANSQIISPGSSVIISYTNSSGQLQTENFNSLINWNKSINVTTTVRPLMINLSIMSSGAANGGYLAIANSGTITQNIYINGDLKSSSINNSASTSNPWGYMISSSPINYTIK